VNTHEKARSWRRICSLVTAIVVVAGGMLWTAGAAQALPACPIPGNFEIDGDMLQGTCTPPGDDWNTPGIGVQSTNQGGTYSTSNKDDSDPSGWSSTGSTPDKTNFEQEYATSRVVGTDFFVYVAWERTDTNGTQGYAIEIDNAGPRVANDTNHTPQPDRSLGGTVFYISSQGSGAPTLDEACSFSSQATYPGVCTTSNANVTLKVNTSPISDPLRGTTQPAGSFFEVALNISGLTGVHPSCPGPAAASVYLRSITGQTSNGNLKGYMAPLSVAPDSTCIPPPITTTATPGGPLNAIGSDQKDTVTVGTGAAPGVGSVTFFLCSPAEVSANGGDCHQNGTKVGANPVTLDVNGQGQSATVNGSSTPNDNATGKYCWRAEFAPSPNDTHYTAGSETNSKATGAAGDECFVIVHGTPAIATQIAVTGANAPGLGFTTLGDSAQLSGFVGSVTGESVAFDLYGPFPGAVPVNCTAAGAAFSTSGTLDATGHATTALTFQPPAAGTYIWIASYAGDALNQAIAGTCADANESVTVVGAQIDVAKSANPPGPVNAGEKIGFDLTVTNDGNVPALGVHVHDVLPAGADGVAGGDLNWALDPAYTDCAITGTAGSQVLDCTFNQVGGPGSLPVIHISSATSFSDCGVVKNKATITTTNGTGTDSDVATVTVLCPQLTIAKVADAPSVSVGSDIGFTVTISNVGQGAATSVDMEDPLPTGPGITWTIASSTGPLTCVIASGTLSCKGDLASGGTQTVHVTSPTAWNANVNSCGIYVNTASVSAANLNPVNDPAPAQASESVLCPDLSLTKTADAGSVNAGTQIGFTIVASNSDAAGTGSAAGVTINDPLPSGSGVDWTIQSQDGTACVINGAAPTQTLHCDIGVLAAGASYTVHIVSDTSFASCATYKNVATLSASNEPSLEADDTTSVLCADLVIHKTADAASVDVGSDIGFTVTVTNTGAGVASAVDVEDPLPAGQGINWTIADQTGPLTCVITGAPPAQVLKCTGDLAATGNVNNDDVQSVHITSSTVWNADHNSCGTYDNTATVTWGNGPADPISSNQASEDVLCPALGIVKHADADSVSAGDNIGFSISITNGGPGTATGVTLHDPLPAGGDVDWSISPAYSGPGTCDITGAVGSQILDCSFGDLASGASFVIHIMSATTVNSCAGYDNTATLHATNEPGLESSASTAVLCPDVSLVKTADAATVNAGESIGFQITVTNSDAAGTGTAKDVVIDDPLPGGPSIDWSIESGPANCSITGTPTTQTLTCSAVALAPGESETVHVVSGTAFESCATYDNTATLTLTNGVVPDPASASTEVQCASLVLTKTADKASVAAGKQLGFTITIANGGPGVASGVKLSDPLPAGDGVTWSVDGVATTATGCNVDNVLDSQVLNCDLGDLISGVSLAVHVVSGTTLNSCARYHNVATLNATNAPRLTADAVASVTTCLQIEPTTPPPPVAMTGAGPVQSELGLVLLLIAVGGLLLLVGRRPRKGGKHA
jgi:uncharacterized repeat protein (TIGR01451 family)